MILLELIAYALTLVIGMSLADFPEEKWAARRKRSNRVMWVLAAVMALLSIASYTVYSLLNLVVFRWLAVAPFAVSGTAWLLVIAQRLRRLGGRHTGQSAGVYRGADLVPGQYGGSEAEMYVLYEPFFEYFYDNSVYCTPSAELYSRDALMRLFVPGREYTVWVDPEKPWDFQCFAYASRGRRCAQVAAVYLVIAVLIGCLP